MAPFATIYQLQALDCYAERLSGSAPLAGTLQPCRNAGLFFVQGYSLIAERDSERVVPPQGVARSREGVVSRID